MTTKDKTGDQLMASIRKTKTEGAAPPDKAPATKPQAAAAAPQKKATAKAKPAAAPKARRTPAKKKAVARPKTGQAAAKAAAGNYQSVERVWPD